MIIRTNKEIYTDIKNKMARGQKTPSAFQKWVSVDDLIKELNNLISDFPKINRPLILRKLQSLKEKLESGRE